MNDSGTGGHRRIMRTSATGDAAPVPATRHPHSIAMIIVRASSGEVVAASPMGYRRLSSSSGESLTRWLAGLATALEGSEPEDDVTTVRAVGGTDAAAKGVVTLWAQCTPILHRSGRCHLVVLRDDAPPVGAKRQVRDPGCGVFTLDAIGRVDSWGPSAQRWTGFSAEHVLGNDTTLLHPGPARLAGEPHRTLTVAYRAGEHRSEGWRLRSDGRSVWAEVTTCALYDPRERLIGFATVMRDLTAQRRLTLSTPAGAPTAKDVPVPRRPLPTRPASTRPMRPSPSRPRSVARPGRVPGQRRPSERS
jgi:PAS domain S-box-containing protein